MGPYYDSIYLMVRQLPEPPDFQVEADCTGSKAEDLSWRGYTTAALSWVRARRVLEPLKILKQPVRRTWAMD